MPPSARSLNSRAQPLSFQQRLFIFSTAAFSTSTLCRSSTVTVAKALPFGAAAVKFCVSLLISFHLCWRCANQAAKTARDRARR